MRTISTVKKVPFTSKRYPVDMTIEKADFQTFCRTIRTLRSPEGCPWDRKQTMQSLQKYIKEESDELLEAIQSNDPGHICEESGDLLFLIALVAEINHEEGTFSMADVIDRINKKMIGRHPHVFAGTPVGSEEELKKQWQKIKSEESLKKIN
jgi:uncharacterized protein YabN with tetrapyrrole methylase and pyrophosphatase domain